MPDSDRVSIDNLTLAPDLSSNDVAPVVHTVNGVKSTYKATMTLLGTFLNKVLEYSADLTTTNKTIIGAINEINAGGGGGGAVILYGTTAPASSLGSDGNLYVQYTAGTGGASDVVDALYAKIDGEWCEISTKQVQSDWSQSDNTKVDYIKNKPTIPTDAEQLPITSGSATNTKSYIDSKTGSDIEWEANTGVSISALIRYLFMTEQSDLNSSLNNGTATPRISYYQSTATNKPSGNSGVVITQGNATYRQQLAIDLEGNIYARYYNNGTISNWVQKA